jgi:uncharacterized protein YndB with AHSA1/START domain
MKGLDHVVERSVLIAAPREVVFRHLTESERFAAWWGPGSRIEPRPGGAVYIRNPNGAVASGEVLRLVPDQRLEMTFGYEGNQEVPPGGSRVVITLEEAPGGTRLHLRHELPSEEARQHYVQGWRYQLAVFANVVAKDQHRELAVAVDRFFAAWAEKDEARRRSALAAIATQDLAFRDAFSCTSGLEDLVPHIGAAQHHMPGVVLERRGEVRQCQGTALVDWVAKGPDGNERGRGTNVFELAPDGRFTRVVGLWS